MAPGRGTRPFHLKDERAAQGATSGQEITACPFCPGREHETPVPVYVDKGDDARYPWSVRVVPNLFAAVAGAPEGTEGLTEGGLDNLTHEVAGLSEVIIETALHYPALSPGAVGPGGSGVAVEMADFSAERMAAVFAAYQTRARALHSDGAFPYQCIFKNAGRDAGASLPHAHSQLMALPFVPPRVAEEQSRTRRSADCFLCRRLSDPAERERMVCMDEAWAAWAPFAAAAPYEIWVMPRQHHGDFRSFSPALLAGAGRMLRDVLRAQRKLHPGLAYNYVFHVLPVSAPQPTGHWHIEVIPRMVRQGGLELGTGLRINPVIPEEAAASLRASL